MIFLGIGRKPALLVDSSTNVAIWFINRASRYRWNGRGEDRKGITAV